MLLRTSSIWQRNSQPMASGKPGAVQFDYVEMFYNPVRKQVRNGMLSPVAFERQQVLKAEGV